MPAISALRFRGDTPSPHRATAIRLWTPRVPEGFVVGTQSHGRPSTRKVEAGREHPATASPAVESDRRSEHVARGAVASATRRRKSAPSHVPCRSSAGPGRGRAPAGPEPQNSTETAATETAPATPRSVFISGIASRRSPRRSPSFQSVRSGAEGPPGSDCARRSPGIARPSDPGRAGTQARRAPRRRPRSWRRCRRASRSRPRRSRRRGGAAQRLTEVPHLGSSLPRLVADTGRVARRAGGRLEARPFNRDALARTAGKGSSSHA
jgi:hypothetical protein